MDDKNRRLALFFMASDLSQKLRSALEFGAVVTIVMVLITFALQNYESFVIRSQLTEAFFLTSDIKAELITYRAQYGQWPDAEPELSNSTLSREHLRGRFVDHIDLHDGGSISVVFNDEKAASSLSGRRLTFRPMVVASSQGSPISWTCSKHNVPEGVTPSAENRTDIEAKYLPSVCREY